MFHIVSPEHCVGILPVIPTSLFWVVMATLEPITGTVRVIFPWYTAFNVPIPTVTWQSYIIKTLVPILVLKKNHVYFRDKLWLSFLTFNWQYSTTLIIPFDSAITSCNLPPWAGVQYAVHKCLNMPCLLLFGCIITTMWTFIEYRAYSFFSLIFFSSPVNILWVFCQQFNKCIWEVHDLH